MKSTYLLIVACLSGAPLFTSSCAMETDEDTLPLIKAAIQKQDISEFFSLFKKVDDGWLKANKANIDAMIQKEKYHSIGINHKELRDGKQLLDRTEAFDVMSIGLKVMANKRADEQYQAEYWKK